LGGKILVKNDIRFVCAPKRKKKSVGTKIPDKQAGRREKNANACRYKSITEGREKATPREEGGGDQDVSTTHHREREGRIIFKRACYKSVKKVTPFDEREGGKKMS